MSKSAAKTPAYSAAWVVVCTLLNCAGWLLSAIHQLNAAGYAVVFLLTAAAVILWLRAGNWRQFQAPSCRKQSARFRRFFPRAFLALTLLAVLGGVLYAPNNYDALSYRVPRILHWLAAGQWHWIHTDFQRVNTRACGVEWLSAPLMALTNSDRLFFLINVASFALLPGLVFSVFRRLGVSARAAWHWMWLAPTGYCFLLQAGSIGNDMLGAVFALAALDFALRAKASGSIGEVWLSILAAALLTGSKTSNIPGLLPVFVALLPSLWLLKRRMVGTAAVGLAALMASFAPMAVINLKYCHDWSGQAAEQASFMRGAPGLRLAQNAVLLTVQNLTPPVFPFAKKWNQAVVKAMPSGLKQKLEATFEPGGAHLALEDMQVEEAAGLGFGVSLLLLATFVATAFSKPAFRRPARPLYERAVLWSAGAAFLPFMWVSGLTAAARLLTPYYLPAIPLLLLRQSGKWTKKCRWWRAAGTLVFLMAGLLVVISPARPLWPAQTVLSKFDASHSALLQRARTVYSVYAQRPEAFAPVVQALPPGLTVLGLISRDTPETSLWRPFGSRRIENVSLHDPAEYWRERGIRYVLVNPELYADMDAATAAQWLADHRAEVAQTIPLTLRTAAGEQNWLLLRAKQ